MDCIFCKIVKGEIPSYKVYEDEDCLAFLDINPVSYGHTLVIPKQHYANMEEVPEEVLARQIRIVKKVGQSLKENLGVEDYTVTENNGLVAGQVIPHIHFHVIPRDQDDGLPLWPQAAYPEGQAEEILNKLKIN